MPAMTPKFTVGVNRAFGRRPCREPIPFQEILPLRLKDSVSGKGDKTSDVACLQDMAQMFACFKKNDFNQALCSKEIGAFQACYTNFLNDREKAKNTDFSSTSSKGRLPYQKLNQILAKYPSN